MNPVITKLHEELAQARKDRDDWQRASEENLNKLRTTEREAGEMEAEIAELKTQLEDAEETIRVS